MAKEFSEEAFELEDTAQEQARSQKIRHIVLCVAALLMVALALALSIWLTNMSVANQAVEKEALLAKQEAEAKALDVNYWPDGQFSAMPLFVADEYKTQEETGYADVTVPPASADNFAAYAKGLLDDGAQLWIDTSKLQVLSYNGVEVHLLNDNSGTHIVFCEEPEALWDGEGYEAFQLPESGRLVKAQDGVLTYRNASISDALAYVDTLVKKGWALANELSVTSNMTYAVLQLGDAQITVDYFKNASDYTVTLENIA